MNVLFSKHLFALIPRPSKRNAAKPLPRSVRLNLEALEGRLVPAVMAAVKPVAPAAPAAILSPQDSFAIDVESSSVTAGAPFQIAVTEVGPNDVPLSSGAVNSANIYVGSGANLSYYETIPLTYGVGFASLTLNDTGPATIKAVYSIPNQTAFVTQAVTGETNVVVDAPQTTSQVWSGYVIQPAQGTTSVGGSWVQSAVTGANGAKVSTWVGMDGWGNGTVEQIGTAATVVNGQTQYTAWWEFFGDESAQTGATGPGYYQQNLPTSFVVRPGDAISADVTYLHSTGSTSTFLFQITDAPQVGPVESWSQQETTTYIVPSRTSAEWIVENPNGGTQALANFGTETFTGAWATIGSTTGAINNFSNAQAVDLSSSSIIKANVDNNPPIYQTTRGNFEPANNLGSSSFSVSWYSPLPIGFPYSVISPLPVSRVDADATAVGVVKGNANFMPGATRQSNAHLDKDLATAVPLVLDNNSLPTSLLMLAEHGAKTNSASDAIWAELADSDYFGSLFSASHPGFLAEWK